MQKASEHFSSSCICPITQSIIFTLQKKHHINFRILIGRLREMMMIDLRSVWERVRIFLSDRPILWGAAPRALNVDGMIFYGQKVTGKTLLDIPLRFFSATSKAPLAGISILLRLFISSSTAKLQARMVWHRMACFVWIWLGKILYFTFLCMREICWPNQGKIWYFHGA